MWVRTMDGSAIIQACSSGSMFHEKKSNEATNIFEKNNLYTYFLNKYIFVVGNSLYLFVSKIRHLWWLKYYGNMLLSNT